MACSSSTTPRRTSRRIAQSFVARERPVAAAVIALALFAATLGRGT
jgi:hypothetical protein